MKKIFTLMLAVGMISVASAQQTKQIIRSGNQERSGIQVKGADYGRGMADYNSYSLTFKQKEAEISRINKSYNQKIAIIQRSRSARTAAMGRKVRQLEIQRDQEIRAVEARYDQTRNNSRNYTVTKQGRPDRW